MQRQQSGGGGGGSGIILAYLLLLFLSLPLQSLTSTLLFIVTLLLIIPPPPPYEHTPLGLPTRSLYRSSHFLISGVSAPSQIRRSLPSSPRLSMAVFALFWVVLVYGRLLTVPSCRPTGLTLRLLLLNVSLVKFVSRQLCEYIH